MEFSKYTINKSIPIPLYYQVKQIILDEINNGNVKIGDAIPTEKTFCDIYDISRTTIRQAITELVNEGYLYRIKSKGTFVSQPKIKSDLVNMYEGFNTELTNLQMRPSTHLIEVALVKANAEQAMGLNLSVGDNVIYILRHRYANGVPMGYIDSYYKYPLCEFFLNEKEENLNSVSTYELIARNTGVRIGSIHKTIEALTATEAEARLFEVKKNSPISQCTNVCIARDTGEPIAYEVVRYRGDKNKFYVELNL